MFTVNEATADAIRRAYDESRLQPAASYAVTHRRTAGLASAVAAIWNMNAFGVPRQCRNSPVTGFRSTTGSGCVQAATLNNTTKPRLERIQRPLPERHKPPSMLHPAKTSERWGARSRAALAGPLAARCRWRVR